ncbi:MAG: 16S rRNA (cytidine(1402)-2'-O)-methyltransferase [Halothiobacillus sp.]
MITEHTPAEPGDLTEVGDTDFLPEERWAEPVPTRWVEPGVLYVVATPIGNLADMTARAIAVLHGVDVIACEDTRHARKLLDHFAIRNRVVALHEHNEAARTNEVAGWLSAGQAVALISDAGTPAISDPGSVLVRRLAELGHPVSPIPGACAAIAALSASGLDSAHFWFEGFLPAKAQGRAVRLQQLAPLPATLIFYEAPHRIRAMLQAVCAELGGTRQAVVGREMTKRFESFVRGNLAQVCAALDDDSIPERGEFVVLIAGADAAAPHADEGIAVARLMDVLIAEQAPARMIARLLTQLTSLKRNEAYAAVQARLDERRLDE